MKEGNENATNMHARRKTESNARTKHILARLQRYFDALPEPRRNIQEEMGMENTSRRAHEHKIRGKQDE